MTAFETCFGIKGKGFAIVVADAHMSMHQIIAVKSDEQKIYKTECDKVLAIIGPSADRAQFSEIVLKNLALYKLKNGVSLTPHAAATWVRNVLANALRKGPYQCDMLMAGWDAENNDASLYYMDHLAGMAKVNKGAHSYAGNFVLGLLDRLWHPNMTIDEGKEAIRQSILEIRRRFALGRLDKFSIRIVTETGVQDLTDDDLFGTVASTRH